MLDHQKWFSIPTTAQSLPAALKVKEEVKQTGETCRKVNLNTGKLSCPPAVGWGGVRSSRAKKRDMKTWHALDLAVQKQYTPLAFPRLPFSILSSLQLMLKAHCPSQHSLGVWSHGDNSLQEWRDNGLPASTPVRSSSRPCVTWECPSTTLNLLWSVSGCSPLTNLEEHKRLIRDTYFSYEYFLTDGNASCFSFSRPWLACSTLLHRAVTTRENRALTQTEECADEVTVQICRCKPWPFGLTWQFLHDQHHLQKGWPGWSPRMVICQITLHLFMCL